MGTDLRHERGRAGEAHAAAHLERLGCTVLAHRHRTRFGELDLVALAGDTLVFVEVKTRRAGSGHPWDALDARKQAQVRRMASAWLAEAPDRPRARHVRFDAIGVVVDGTGALVAIDHLEGAF